MATKPNITADQLAQIQAGLAAQKTQYDQSGTGAMIGGEGGTPAPPDPQFAWNSPDGWTYLPQYGSGDPSSLQGYDRYQTSLGNRGYIPAEGYGAGGQFLSDQLSLKNKSNWLDNQYLPFLLMGGGMAAAVAAGAGAAGAAGGTAGGLDSAGGVLNNAVMSGGAGTAAGSAGAVGAAGAAGSAGGVGTMGAVPMTTAGGYALPSAVAPVGAAGVGAAGATGAGGGVASYLGSSAGMAAPAASTAAFNSAVAGSGGGLSGFLTSPTGILAGSQLASGLMGAYATNKAGNIAANAANQATQAQKDMFNTTVGLESPFRQYGVDSMTKLSSLMNDSPTGLLHNFGASDFTMDPGYQYQLKYGNQALQNSQAAKNGVLSGGALKDLVGFNQDYAGQAYQSAYDRYMANKKFTYGSLMDGATLGQAAAGNTTSAAPSFSSGIGNTMVGAGQASAAGLTGAASSLASGVSGAANSYFLNSLLKNYANSGAAASLSSFG